MSKKQRKSCTQFSSLKQGIETPQKSTRSSHKESLKQPSTKANNPEKMNANMHSKINMQTMFEANKEYLMEKIAISEIPRPSKYYHKIPLKTPGTTYNNQFSKANSSNINALKLERKDNLTNQKKPVTNYESLYGQNFGHLDQRAKSLAASAFKDNYSTLQPKEKTSYQPVQGPTFLDTSYSLNFIKHLNPVPTQSAKMKEVNLMGGGKFKGESHYNGAFKGHEQKKEKPIHHSNNKIFMTIVAPKETTYDKMFNTIQQPSSSRNNKTAPKTAEDLKSSKKRVNSQMLETTKEMEKKKYKSEYERSFQTLQPPSSSRSKKGTNTLMSFQDMKNLILNAL